MTFAGLAVLASVVTRVTGLDHAGVAFCYFKALTGYACMTCGTTRAFGHLSRLDLSAAFAVQPLVTVGALGVVLWGLVDALLQLWGRRTVVDIGGRTPKLLLATTVGLASLNWAYLLAAGV